ncbi:MAG: hypothetical protein AABX29_03425 [Nanoarchaeota archaeon]
MPGKIGTLEEFFKAWVEAKITNKKGKLYVVGEKNKRLIKIFLAIIILSILTNSSLIYD